MRRKDEHIKRIAEGRSPLFEICFNAVCKVFKENTDEENLGIAIQVCCQKWSRHRQEYTKNANYLAPSVALYSTRLSAEKMLTIKRSTIDANCKKYRRFKRP